MPNSISSADQTKTQPTEWLLARFTDSTRAVAILGDLTEMASTRGRLWFWTAYWRTLVSLGWRTPVAFISGFAGFWLMLPLVLKSVLAPHALEKISGTPWLTLHMFLMTFGMSLWFAVPYAFLRYGFRDRVTHLYGIFFLLTTPVIFHSNSISLICCLLLLAIIVAAFFTSIWRRPMIVLSAMPVVSMASLSACGHLETKIYHPHFRLHEFNWTSWLAVRLSCAIAFLIAGIVFSRLHRWLMERPASTDRSIA
jgi:hypothetical protein